MFTIDTIVFSIAAFGSVLLVSFAIAQLVWLRTLHRQYRQPTDVKGSCLKTAVVLTLRGADPFLEKCLAGLLRQDHSDYAVFVTIDSPEDPSAELVRRVLRDETTSTENVVVSYLQQPRMTCGMRLEALLQTVESLDRSFEVIVTCDADTIPHSSWLRELVCPMRDTSIGVTTGIRWYMPDDAALGSLVRYFWNYGAILQMSALDIGWGGSLAIRRTYLEQTGLVEKWTHILFEDTFTSSELSGSGWKLKYVPSATMVNRESIDFKSCVSFVTRQLLNVRLYHRNWKYIVGLAIVTFSGILLSISAIAFGLATGTTSIVLTPAAAVAAYIVSHVVSVVRLERDIRSAMRARGEAPPAYSLRMFAAGAFAQFVYFFCLWQAMRTHSVEWRGLRYEIAGPSRVRLLAYQPYAIASSVGSLHSL